MRVSATGRDNETHFLVFSSGRECFPSVHGIRQETSVFLSPFQERHQCRAAPWGEQQHQPADRHIKFGVEIGESARQFGESAFTSRGKALDEGPRSYSPVAQRELA